MCVWNNLAEALQELLISVCVQIRASSFTKLRVLWAIHVWRDICGLKCVQCDHHHSLCNTVLVHRTLNWFISSNYNTRSILFMFALLLRQNKSILSLFWYVQMVYDMILHAIQENARIYRAIKKKVFTLIVFILWCVILNRKYLHRKTLSFIHQVWSGMIPSASPWNFLPSLKQFFFHQKRAADKSTANLSKNYWNSAGYVKKMLLICFYGYYGCDVWCTLLYIALNVLWDVCSSCF